MTMNKYLKIHLNWRVNVLSILAIVVTLFIVADSKDLLVLFLTKIVGLSLGYLTFRMGKYWHSKGKIDELMELAKEE